MREETGRLKFGGMTLRRGGGGRQGRTGRHDRRGFDLKLSFLKRAGVERSGRFGQ
jgi:hypothetical protein